MYSGAAFVRGGERVGFLPRPRQWPPRVRLRPTIEWNQRLLKVGNVELTQRDDFMDATIVNERLVPLPSATSPLSLPEQLLKVICRPHCRLIQFQIFVSFANFNLRQHYRQCVFQLLLL